MEELKKYHNRINAVVNVIYGRNAKHLPETIDGCVSLLKRYEEKYGVIY